MMRRRQPAAYFDKLYRGITRKSMIIFCHLRSPFLPETEET